MKANYAPKKYISIDEHERILQQSVKEASTAGMLSCTRFMFACTVLALKDCGFSDRSADRIMKKAYNLYQSVAKGDVHFEEIEETLKEEYGITFQWEEE